MEKGPLYHATMNVQKMTRWKGGKTAVGGGVLPARTDSAGVQTLGDVLDRSFPCVQFLPSRPPCSSFWVPASPRLPIRLNLRRQAAFSWATPIAAACKLNASSKPEK